ncbi:hypothetical protein EDB89DRAFT_219733 [Lactarius sanguifluus]|nr:hypothetical protein EDB89DRAFT_219733 [Lactarius sanguifluus]
MTAHSRSEVGDISLALQDDSSSGATFRDHYRDSNVEDIPRILRAKRPKVQAQGGESYGSATTIDTLPGDVLLEIFYSYQTDQDTDDEFWPTLVPASCRWLRLVHVCRRWRQIVLGSPRRLDLQLLCTHGTPVRTDLGSLPPFPLAIVYGHLQGLTSYDKDNLFAALEHLDRICHVNLSLPSSQLRKAVTKMQESFPALKHLALLSEDKNALVLPDGFLGGTAPCLQRVALGGIIFPTLPTLLSSSSNLVGLKLYDIPRNGYVPPEAMIAYLATLPRLETFYIGFQSATSRPDQILTPPETRTPLPSLISIGFRGASEYLEDLVSRIDSPQLNQIHISYLNQLVEFQVAQPFKFVDRSEDPELSLLGHADVTFTNRLVSLDLYQHLPRPPNRVPIRISILCRGIDWQVSHIAQVLSHRHTILSHLVDLKLEFGEDEDSRVESVDNAEWLHLLRQFSAVQTLRVSRKLAGHVALALEDVTVEMAAEVLPALKSIDLVDQLASSVDKFLAVRRLSGRPVTVNPSERKKGDKRLEDSRSLILEYQQIIHADDREVIEEKII